MNIHERYVFSHNAGGWSFVRMRQFWDEGRFRRNTWTDLPVLQARGPRLQKDGRTCLVGTQQVRKKKNKIEKQKHRRGIILRNFPLYYSRMRGKISHIQLSEITRLNLTPAGKRSLSLLTRPWHKQLAAFIGSRPGRSALQHDTVPGYPLQWNRVIRRGFDCTLYFPHTQILGVTKPFTFVFIFPFFI